MDTLRALFSSSYWKNGFSFIGTATSLLASFGILWLLVEIVTFFSPDSAASIKTAWWVFLILGVVLALWVNRPIHEVSCTLSGRDIQIRIRVGDFFAVEGAKVIGSNTTFDTDIALGLINKSSIQGQFTSRNYSSVSHLDADLKQALKDVTSTAVSITKTGKQDLYPVGTVAKVTPQGGTAYLLAIAHLNLNGVASGNFEDLKLALPALWEFISTAGSIEPIVIPVLGSGFSRLPEKREEIIREILNSFIAACAAKRFTDCLTIVMHPRDFYKNAVDLSELSAYLKHVCRYTEFGAHLRPGRGVPIG